MKKKNEKKEKKKKKKERWKDIKKMTKVTPTPDTILTEMRLTDNLINCYDLKRAGLPKRYHQEHKQRHRDKGKWKEAN